MSGTAVSNFWKSSMEFLKSPLGPLYEPSLVREFGASDPLYGPTLEKSVEARRNTQLACCYVGAPLGPLPLIRLNNHLIDKITARSVFVEEALKMLAALHAPGVGMIAGLCLGAYVGNRWHKLSGQNAPEAEAKFYEWLQNRASAKS